MTTPNGNPLDEQEPVQLKQESSDLTQLKSEIEEEGTVKKRRSTKSIKTDKNLLEMIKQYTTDLDSIEKRQEMLNKKERKQKEREEKEALTKVQSDLK